MGPWTYLVFELAWALPVILGQWVVGRDRLLARWRLLLLGTLIPTLYLCAADAFAIRVGIWQMSPTLTTNVRLGGLPLEEGIFFLLTNVMVVQGILLVESGRDQPPSAPDASSSRAARSSARSR